MPQAAHSTKFHILLAVLFSALFWMPATHAAEVSKADVENAANAGDYDAAYTALRQLAESGNAQAQGFLAHVLYTGEWGFETDWGEAKQWLQKAYAQNDAYSTLFIALQNRDMEPNPVPAEHRLITSNDWRLMLRYAAENGHPYAQHAMGEWAIRERLDFKQAAYWFGKAAELGGQEYSEAALYALYNFMADQARMDMDKLSSFRSTGNWLVYRALTFAYTFGYAGVEEDIHEAAIYQALCNVFETDFECEGGSRPIIAMALTETEAGAAAKKAIKYLIEWSDDPHTYIGEASQWCKETGEMTLACISSISQHRLCAAPYMLWNFKGVTGFTAYQACRTEYDPLFPPGEMSQGLLLS